MGRVAMLAVAVVVAGCGFLPKPTPAWVVDRDPLPACGQENVGLGDGYDSVARRCLLDAFQTGRGGELISRGTTIEGDPITRYTRVHDDGSVEVIVDATRDDYGSGEWERLHCDRLITVEEAEEPGTSFPEEMVFIEDGCEFAPIPR